MPRLRKVGEIIALHQASVGAYKGHTRFSVDIEEVGYILFDWIEGTKITSNKDGLLLQNYEAKTEDNTLL
jgi:hypothetical protein